MIYENNHIHSTYSDGELTPKEIVKEFMNMKPHYSWITFTDHVDKKTKWFDKYYEEISKLEPKYYSDCAIYAGCEVKMCGDGLLNTTNEILNKSELVIASVHNYDGFSSKDVNRFDMNGLAVRQMKDLSFDEMLDIEVNYINLILNSKQKIDVLGHPFANLEKYHSRIGNKIPMSVIENVYKLCVKKGIMFEINSKDQRPEVYEFIHKTLNRKNEHTFSFGSDFHKKEDLIGLHYDMFNFKKVNVLVTGVGGGVGQAILQCLNPLRHNIFVADCNPCSAGLNIYRSSKKIILPKAINEKEYIESIYKNIKKYNLDCILVGGDLELEVLAKYKDKIYSDTYCDVIVSDSEIIEIANDKLKTAKFCLENKINHPITVNSYEFYKFPIRKLPVIVKPTKGYSSNNVFTCNSSFELYKIKEYLDSKKIEFIIQQKINGREITCEVVKDIDNNIKGIICLERDIYKGVSYRTKVVKDKDVIDFVRNLAEKYKFDYVCNFQLIQDVATKKIYLMEINCRFSGTTHIRNKCGFDNVNQIIMNNCCDQEVDTKSLNKIESKIFYRYWTEVEGNEDFSNWK